VSFSRDSKLVASGSLGRTVRIWLATTGECRPALGLLESSAMFVALSQDSKFLVSGSVDPFISVWMVETGERLQMHNGPTDGIEWAGVSHDSKLILVFFGDNNQGRVTSPWVFGQI
jgi:hypothetical protein